MKKNIKMMKWAKDLFPICRSLTGKGNIETLNYFKKINKNFKIKSYRSGSKYFDWKIPAEWNINDAYIQDNNGKKFCEFKKNNLHLVGYSQKINKELSFKELKKKIYFDKLYPNSIPYVTSYYKQDWGFCMRYNDFINDSFGISSIPGKLIINHKEKNLKMKKLLGINPGASYGSAKQWYPEEFANVAISLSREYDIIIFKTRWSPILMIG